MGKSITVLFFATLRERIGEKGLNLEVPSNATARDVKNIVAEKYPHLCDLLAITIVSINHDFAADDELVPDGAEVALFPPVSGGSETEHHIFLDITEDEFDLNEIVEKISDQTTGAVAIFTGLVRGITTRGQLLQTEHLLYEAYQPMAEIKIRQIVSEIKERWPSVVGIAIVQRIGHLEPGTKTVCIACSAAHRDTGVFQATRFGIDRLKQIVPLWKKEVGPSGEQWVHGGYDPNSQTNQNI